MLICSKIACEFWVACWFFVEVGLFRNIEQQALVYCKAIHYSGLHALIRYCRLHLNGQLMFVGRRSRALMGGIGRGKKTMGFLRRSQMS